DGRSGGGVDLRDRHGRGRLRDAGASDRGRGRAMGTRHRRLGTPATRSPRTGAMTGTLGVEVSGDGIATVTLNRPDKRNALSIELRDDLTSMLEKWHDDDAVKVLVRPALRRRSPRASTSPSSRSRPS